LTYVRRYRLAAAEDKTGDLVHAVSELVRALHALPGFQAGRILTQRHVAGIVFLDEHWSSAQAHAASNAMLPKAQLTAVMSIVSEPPTVIEFDEVE
jgi:quinol monooxygenase YgiN